jgi:hypothetical protein
MIASDSLLLATILRKIRRGIAPQQLCLKGCVMSEGEIAWKMFAR